MKQFNPFIVCSITLVLLSATQFVVAQKNQDKSTLVNYVRQPFFQLPDFVQTYSSKVYFNKYLTDALRSNQMEEPIKNSFINNLILDGYERVEENSDIVLVANVSISKPLISNLKSYPLVFEYKEKEGDKEVVKQHSYTAYCYEITYGKALVNFQMKTSSGVYLIRDINAGEQSELFGSKDYNTCYKDAATAIIAWEKEGQNFLKGVISKWFSQIPSDLSVIIGEYCLRKSTHVLEIEAMKKDEKDKTDNYEVYNRATTTLFEGLALLKSDTIVTTNKLVRPKFEVCKAKIKEAIAIWENMLYEGNPMDKKVKLDKKIARLVYFDIAKAYTWIEDFPKAKEYLQLRWENKGGFLGIADQSVDINRFDKFLQSQELRFIENSWRTIYRNASASELARVQKKESIRKPIEYDKPAKLFIYADGSGLTDAKYTILLNNQRIDENLAKGKALIEPGNTLIYDIYSEGFVQISLARLDANGDIIKLGYVFDEALGGFVGNLASGLVDNYVSNLTSGYSSRLVQSLAGGGNNSSVPNKVNVIPFLTSSMSDRSYQNFRRTDQYIHVQPGGSYFYRINFIDKSINAKEEIEGETEFYRRAKNVLSVELEENENAPIPNMSIFNSKMKIKQ